MRLLPVIVALIVAAGSAAGAQLYRWVDEKGRVEWRDTPPPPEAKNVQQRTMSGNTIETSGLPYNVQQAVRNFPVTLWVVAECGDPCNMGRSHLAKRGVPYSERDGRKEVDALKKLTGGIDVPVLTVGSRTLKGYLDTDWDAALDNAGYPRTPPPGMKTQAATGKLPPPGDAAKAGAPKPPAKQP